MRLALHTETKAYKVETQGNGLFVTITSKDDGATAFLQGDDAAEFLAVLEPMDNARDMNRHCSEQSFALPEALTIGEQQACENTGWDN